MRLCLAFVISWATMCTWPHWHPSLLIATFLAIWKIADELESIRRNLQPSSSTQSTPSTPKELSQ